MKIVIAPDSFKGSVSAKEAATALADGMRRAFPNARYELIPMADGGEGTVDAMVDATGGRRVTRVVSNPLGEPVEAAFGILGDGKTAVIEMAAASGLNLIPPNRRNPMNASTYGTGELIRAALDEGATSLIIGIGGSATNDGGMGMAQALGVVFRDANRDELPPRAEDMARMVRMDASNIDPRVKDVKVTVACDVNNPLTGERGASAVYGPQKGATPKMVFQLEGNLKHYAMLIRRDIGVDIEMIPGAGAAGGLGAGLMAFLNAELKRGVEIVLEALEVERHMAGAAFVVTGEGELNGQTANGKTPMGVALTAKRLGLPVFAVAGSIAPDVKSLDDMGIDAAISLVPRPMTLEDAISNALPLLQDAGERLARLVRAASTINAAG